VPATVLYLIDPSGYATPGFHLFSGATMLGAFFIATEPVSAASTDLGRLIYGTGIGLLVYALRTWGAYPDGVAFSVLLMNGTVPLINRYTRPRIYGQR
jgi:electron transport complex protein RnfD